MKKHLKSLVGFIGALSWSLSALLLASPALATDDHAVVLLYHHVSNDTPASTSVSPAILEKHLSYLEQHGFSVWALGRILKAIAEAQPLPKNTIAISFDDANLSVYTEAFPRFQQRGWPFTLFVSTEAIDKGYKNYLNWDQIRELAEAGIEIGNHSHSHAHLIRKLENESESAWRQRISTDIRQASARLTTETGITTELFAYPYGEYSEALKKMVGAMGYLGVAQQSGAVGVDSDLLAVPRFPMATGYADMQRFIISINSRPLPVNSVVVEKGETKDERINKLWLVLAKGGYNIKQLACYGASGKPIPLTPGDELPRQFVLDLSGLGSVGRNKINCTAPASDEAGVYYWYSYQWLMRRADGSWYEE